MPYQATILKQFSLAGKSYTLQDQVQGPDIAGTEQTINPAQPAVLTTHTSGTVGVLTMNNAMHGITTGMELDLYWIDANGRTQFCHNVTAGTVAGTSVPITVPTDSSFPETALPPATTAINVGLTQSFSLSANIVGNDVLALLIGVDIGPAVVRLLDAVPTEDLVANLQPGGCAEWLSIGPYAITNPIAGDTITTVHMSQGDPNAAHNVRVAALLST